MMRRVLVGLFIGVSLAGTLGAYAAPTHAQFDGSANIDAALQEQQATAAEQQAAATPTAPDNSSKIAISNPVNGEAYGSVMQWIMKLFAFLVMVAAVTLQYAVYYTVVTMGNFVSNLSAIGVTWRILRDIGNIILIFGFLAIGLSTILNIDIYGWSKKALFKLLVAAVFLNFSLLITEAIIDVGNLFATQFYTQINGGVLPTPPSSDFYNTLKNEGISNKIMAQVGLQNIYGDASRNANVFTASNQWLVGFMGIILFLVTAFVMFSLAFILIARFVVLLILIILSPVALAGYAVPNLRGVATRWWSKLLGQTITAPILLLLLYIALAIITDASFLSGFGVAANGQQWTGFASGNLDGFAATVLSFIVAMALLLLVTIVAKGLSASGADGAIKMAGTVVGGFTGRGVIGGTSLAGRVAFGGLGTALNNQRIQAGAKQSGLKGFAFKAAAFTGRNLENRTYDLRNSKIASSIGGKIGSSLPGGFSAVNAGMGKGATVTAKTAKEATIKAYKEYKPFSGTWWRDQQKEYEKADADLTRKRNLAAVGTPPFEAALKKMSADELAELRGIRQGLAEFVGTLSPAKYAELQKSDKLLSAEKDKIKKRWEDQFITQQSAKATLDRFKPEDIASMDSKLLVGHPNSANIIENLGVTELEAIRRKASLTIPERRALYARMSQYRQMATAQPPQPLPNTPLGNAMKDYFDSGKDAGGGRDRFWNV